MPEYLAPGVYIEEVPATNKPIEGVSTSTTGLVGVTERGPVNVPQIVTSYAEYRRLFGDALPESDFTDPGGRRHCYLPHAVEGFFVNGGKRAWITRVVPREATPAGRFLFHADPANLTAASTVLLRQAQQGTGSTLSPPPLFVLDPANLLPGDWLRVGSGSRSDYHQVVSTGAAAAHTALRFPLYFAHAAGTLTRQITPTDPAAALTPLALRDAVAAGATQLVVTGTTAIIANLVAAMPGPADHQLLQVGAAAAAEHCFATALASLSTTEARLTLATPLRRGYDPGTAVRGLTLPAGANVPLALAANAGDLLIYGPGFSTATDLVVVGVGSPQAEVQGIGELATLPLDLGPYAPYPAGTLGESVAVADDTRTVVAIPSNTVVPLTTVSAMSAGMTFTRGTDSMTVTTVDPQLSLVRLAAPLPGAALAAGDAVTVGAAAATVAAYPTRTLVPLDTVNGILPGMTFDNGGDQAPVAAVLPGLRLVVLASALGAAPAVAAAVTVGGNGYTVADLIRSDCFPVDDVAGLAPGMGIDVAGNAGVIAALDTRIGAIALQGALPAAPAAGDTITPELRHTTAWTGAGSLTLSLDNRLGIEVGDVLRIGTAPDEEYATVARVLGDRGTPPDAGAVQLLHPLGAAYASGSAVTRQQVTPDASRQPAILALAAAPGDDGLLVSDGTAYVANDLVRLTTPDGVRYIHRLDGNAVAANPRALVLDAALAYSHGAGEPVVERNTLLEVQALDAGTWGNRLLVAAADEAGPLIPKAEVLAANPAPGPGLFSSLQLVTLTGAGPGTILELLDPDGVPVAGAPLLKVRRLDRTNRLALLDPPGLQPVHINAVTAALGAGLRARVRSREFSLSVLLLRRPDPLIPSSADEVQDQELYRQLSMDPRHSHYFERVIGVTFTPGATTDDEGNPVRLWDRRSEGASAYVRVLDLTPLVADRQAIRLGPEPLIDTLPSGLTRAARLPLFGGDDAVSLMDDPLYLGDDSNEPAERTGLQSLKNPQGISLLAIPGQTSPILQQALIDQCELLRFRFAVLDGPPPDNDTLVDVQNQRGLYDSHFAALYHPWLSIPDPFPLSPGTPRQFPIPPCGHVLGLYARVDDERGVHKAPANEVLRGISGLTRYFNQQEQDLLNPYPTNINVVRDFRPNNRGIRVWGARSITSEPERKYVNVNRLMIFLEESIYRGLQWVVFEPNATALWAQVRRTTVNFLTSVWRNGALEGDTPEQGFYVRCDRTTMTQDDLDNGRLICLIGVAPVKPAEFVIIRIGLWTADSDS